jgi:MoxR-like ATPase
VQTPLRERLFALLQSLEQGLVERRATVRLALLAALAGEHSLLIGPPGTAKSELAQRLHLAFKDAAYFERLLTRFSVPEELFGPLSISALEQDRYERQTAGYLPQASIAFIDEVFKANSAILNALLTLLNERQFDNGAGRQACPLISVIGATNEVPEDEVAEAFFDRFLMRLPVAPVSAEGFRALLALGPGAAASAPPPVPSDQALDAQERAALASAASGVVMPEEVALLLGDLRAWLSAQKVYVSDRRWVKIRSLLSVAAACEGRPALKLWDLWLLPCCVAADAAGQANVGDWLVARLGLREAMSPPRLTHVVEAFEAQARLEQDADDLDYDASGRLKFSTEINDKVADAKGAAQVTRMKYTRRRRYGDSHILARTRQIDELLDRIGSYLGELRAQAQDLAAYRQASLWTDPGLATRALSNLDATAELVEGLKARAEQARVVFENLPRLPVDPLTRPEPIQHEPLAA